MGLLRNAGWRFSSLLLGGGLLFLVNLYLMRVKGPMEYGQWAFAMGWAGMFSVLVDFGFNPLVSRDISQFPERGFRYLRHVFSSKLLLAAVAFVLLMTASALRPEAVAVHRLVIGAFLFLTCNSIVESGQNFLNAYQEFRLGAILSVLYKGLIAGAGFWALTKAATLPGVMQAITGAALAGMLIHVSCLSRVTVTRKSQDSTKAADLWRQALPIFLQNVFILIYFKVDTVMLTLMRGNIETGIYGAAYRFFELSNVVPTALTAAVTAPLARRILAKDWPPYWWRLFWLFLVSALAGAIILGTGISHFLPVWIGQEFASSRALLRILSLTLLFYFPNYLLTMTLVFLKRGEINAWIAGVAMIFNIGMNLLAIPRWGAAGAAWTTLFTEAGITLASGAAIYLIASRSAGDPDQRHI